MHKRSFKLHNCKHYPVSKSTQNKKEPKFISENKLAIVGPKITTTYSISQTMVPTMDLELLIPVDRPFKDTEKYKFKPEFKLVNCLKSIYIGNPINFNNEILDMQKFVEINKSMPITSLYTVNITEVKTLEDMDKFHAELYIAINPNLV